MSKQESPIPKGSHTDGNVTEAQAPPPKNQLPPQTWPPSEKPGPYKEDTDKTSANLSTVTVASNIPRGNSDENWQYPSPQRFYNAMQKKGWDPKAEDMVQVVSIHNTVNEKCWKRILEFESLHKNECVTPKLLKFQGKPKELSPKAKFYHYLGYTLPFDRHDWIIDRCGKQVRYILDFYTGKKIDDNITSIYLDIRPELSLGGTVDRLRMQIQEKFFHNKQHDLTPFKSTLQNPHGDIKENPQQNPHVNSQTNPHQTNPSQPPDNRPTNH